MSRQSRVQLLTLLLVTAPLGVTAQEHWNQFRGPHGDGTSAAMSLPTRFTETENVRWKIAVPGVGWSSPVVWGDQIWMTSGRSEGRELLALCVDASSGRLIHKVKVFDVVDPSMEWSNQNPHATPTPYVEAGRVYVHFGSYGTACLDTATGEVLWKREDLKCNHRVGPASSPVVFSDWVFLQFDGVDQQYVVALEKATGKTRWRTDREVTSDLGNRLRAAGLSETAVAETKQQKPGDNRKSYATPTVIEVDGAPQLISPGAEVLFSYDPATGNELWRVDLDGWSWNVACRPVFSGGLLYVTAGISQKLLAVRPDGRGNVTDTHVIWSADKGAPNMSSPLVVEDHLYMVSDKGGIASCLKASTGEELWRTRISGNHWASPVHAGNRLYFASREGNVVVLGTDSSETEPQVVSRNRLDAQFIASPAVANDSLILRSTTHLYCLASGFQRSAEDVAAESRAMKEMQARVASADDKKKNPQKIDWDAAYERLLKSNPGVKRKVASGDATREDVIAWLKSQKEKPAAGKGKGRMGKSGKGKGGKNSGETGFYAVVIGKLKSRDIELGEFTMVVDHVSSMYSNRWVKDEIVGKTVTVRGVSGQFLDNLLLIKRGDTLKVRTGSYQKQSQVLTFGMKFHVLERTAPFDPAAFGVPPQKFRGFNGIVRGRIVEAAGYELLLDVGHVEQTAESSKAADPQSVKGQRLRIVGFFNQHAEAFGDLHAGDTIRVSLRHADPRHDEFQVSELLEVVGARQD